MVTDIAAKVCHVLWLLEILSDDLHSGYMFVFPFKVKAFLAALTTHQDNSSLPGYIFLSCHQSCQTD